MRKASIIIALKNTSSSDETMSWLDGLLMTCKHFNVDYYNASEKDRAFVEAVARKNMV